MPVWMEVLLNVVAYVGFITIATFNRSADKTPDEEARQRGCVS